MTSFQKAMVLLDLAREELARAGTLYPPGHGDLPDITDAIEDIGTILYTLESFSSWPKWS